MIVGGPGIEVTGSGSTTNPFVVETLDANETLSVQDDNTTVLSGVTTLDFQGTGVTVTNPGTGGEVVVAIPGGAGGSGVAIENEGTEVLAAAARLNFTGAGVTASDAGSGEIQVDIPGGGGGSGSGPAVACGTTIVTIPTGQSRTSVAVTFPVGRFSAIPKVTTSNAAMTVSPSCYTGSSGTTISGVNIWATERDGVAVGSPRNVTVDWIAMQQS